MRLSLLFLFYFTILLNITMHAQQLSLQETGAFADKLVEKKILTIAGKQKLLEQAAQKNIEIEHPSTVKQISYTSDELSKETILKFCSDAFFIAKRIRLFKHLDVEKKIIAEDSMFVNKWVSNSLFFSGGKLDKDYIYPKRSTIGMTRTRTLNDFKATGLISDVVYNECLSKLSDSTIKDETELLDFMCQRSIYYRYYDFNKKEQEEYIDSLVKTGLLTGKAREELLHAYHPYELKTIPEMLGYSNRYVLIDLSEYKPVPAIIYPVVFEKIKNLVPDFNYQDLTVAIEEKKESDLIRQDIKLSFRLDGNEYNQVFFHDYRREVYDAVHKEMPPSAINQDFHKGVNKWLTDRESAFRLYTVNIMPGENYSPFSRTKIGLLLLQEGEAEKITKDVNLLSSESFDNRLSKKNINKLIAEFTAQGFFKHLSTQEIDTARQKIASADIGSLEDILLCFPKTIVLFDWEAANLENPYEDLTQQFALAARGAVLLTNITDEYKKGWKKQKKVKYGFSINGKKYETMLPFEGDWLAPEFMELLKKALTENSIDGNIYYCIDNGQEAGYIFLTSKQHQFILEHYPDLIKG